MKENTEKKNIREEILSCAEILLRFSVSADYATTILSAIEDDVVNDVMETSGIAFGEDFTDSDVKYAIGRVLCKRLGVEIY